MTKLKLVYSVLLILTVLSVTQFTGCGSDDNNTSDVHTYWFTDPPSRFHTNDIERAQKEIPFPILLPNYLPSDLVSLPLIEGPIKGTYPDDEVSIRVTYQERRGSYLLVIKEAKGTVVVHPAPESEFSYLDINGTQVLEVRTEGRSFSSSGLETHPILEFSWNRKGIFFNVIVFNNDHEEAVRVVESMIQQGL
ncbi:MAG: hypothetical protein FJ004_11630 [Chloroflexi bacterium]|nr:hypothetical protein [Chloroflexota bacterium]